MEPREEEKREPKAPEVPKAEQKLRRFRLVKLEDRVAPLAGGKVGWFPPTFSGPECER
jgi:hypothetical protein